MNQLFWDICSEVMLIVMISNDSVVLSIKNIFSYNYDNIANKTLILFHVYLTRPLFVLSRDTCPVLVSWTLPFFLSCSLLFQFAKRFLNKSPKYSFQLSGSKTTINPNNINKTPANFMSWKTDLYINVSITKKHNNHKLN